MVAAPDRKQAKLQSLVLVMASLACALLIALHWAALARLEATGDVYASPKPYPPYLYINDFTQFYAIGKLAGSPERALIYDAQTQDRYLNQVISPKHTTKICYGQNVPWFFMLMVPFAALPLRVSYFAYCAFGVLFGSAGLVLLLRRIRNLNWLQTTTIVLACNAAMPAWFALNHGNTSYFLLGFACLYTFAMLNRKDIPGGIALALLAQKPQYAIPAAIPAFRYCRFKLIAIAALVEAAIWIAAAIYLGPANVIGYPKTLFSTDTNSNLDGMYPQQMVSVRAMFATYVSEHASMPLACATFAVGLVVLLFVWLRVKEEDRVQNCWAFALTYLAMLVVSPHTSMYDVLLLSLPAVLTVPLAERVRTVAIWPRTWFLLLASYPITSWVLYLIEDPFLKFQHRYISFFQVLLLAVLSLSYFQLFRRAKPVPAQSAATAD